MNKTDIKKVLDSALIDPNSKGNFIENQLVQLGNQGYYETRTVEFIAEARRIRLRYMDLQEGSEQRKTLIELYRSTLTKAITSLAVCVCKIETNRDES